MEVRIMRGRKIWFAVFLSGVMLAVAIPQRAQSPAAPPPAEEHARSSVAVNMLRAINTAEWEYKSRRGSFAGWDVLVGSGEFTGRGMHFAALNEPQLSNAQFATLPELLPGWALRLNVTSGGKGSTARSESIPSFACAHFGKF